MWLRAKGERVFARVGKEHEGRSWQRAWLKLRMIPWMIVWKGECLARRVLKCYQVCLNGSGCMCVSSALSHDSVLLPIVRLHPRLLLRPLPRLCGAGPWCAPVKTLSHSLVTEQRSWGWNKLRSWHENMQWGTLPWPRASTSRVCYPSA